PASRQSARKVLTQATRSTGDQGITWLRHFCVVRVGQLGPLDGWLGSLPWGRLPGTVQAPTHVLGIASLENSIQYAAACTEAPGHPVGSVMIEVVPLHVAKVRIAEIAVMRGVVDPFFHDIRLESASHNH